MLVIHIVFDIKNSKDNRCIDEMSTYEKVLIFDIDLINNKMI